MTFMKNLPACFRLCRVLALLAALGCATAAHAGTFTTAAWTNDASSGLAAGATSWAYHFGATTTPTNNGVPVTGLLGPTATNVNFDLAGTPFVYLADDPNNVTNAGNAEVARRFVFGGNPATVIVKGLTVGSPYTVSFLSVGFDAPGGRQVTFASGTDIRLVDQDQFGDNNGIRVDYTFTASGDFVLVENLVESFHSDGYQSIDV